ncbi:MAG: hypothetical protein ACIAQ0_02325 [Phycisphaerales bacterium JB058]
MDNKAQAISTELYNIDLELKELRSRLRDLKEARAALVDTITGILGTEAVVNFEVSDGKVTATPKRTVSFPTKEVDPEKQQSLITRIKSLNQWERFSMLNYPGLKAAWIANHAHDSAWRTELMPFAIETVELKIRSITRSQHNSSRFSNKNPERPDR